MLALDFKLVGLGEEQRIEAHSDSSSRQPLPQEWNQSKDSQAFRYTHPQSSMQYLLKATRLGPKTLIHGIGMGDDKTTTFEVTSKDYVSEAALPSSPTASSASEEDAIDTISNVYISPSRLTDLGSGLRLNVIQRLVPGLQKEGYEDTSTSAANTSGRTRSDASNTPRHDPLRDDPTLPQPAQPAQPHNPLIDPSVGPRRPPVPVGEMPPPGFEDEHGIFRPPRGIPPAGGFGPNIGERDLYPPGLGPNDPLRMGPGARGPGGGGGMHPTLDDPMFGGGRGAGEYDPSAPPGARYDPPLPGAGQPRDAGRGRFGGMGGRPPNPFDGFGDNDFI
ncbi:MAG: hypothetical protein M1831_003567 [Alyxoria varia]|nr:MAG: hypothetical protein M1831_003567 [Alyxoria varia]